MQRVIVTGGGGFIGSYLVDKLISMGIEVHVIDKSPSNINPKAYYHPFDISVKLEIYDQLFENIDIVFHLAAETSVQESIENPYLHHKSNVTGTLNMLEASKKANVKKFIFSSSSAIYGEPQYTPLDEKHPLNPLSPYALSKIIGEQYCKIYSELYNLNTICLRYFNAYGDRMPNVGAYRSVISVFDEQHSKNLPLNIVNDGNQKRDFIHAKDIAQANILAALTPTGQNNIFNVGTGQAYTVNEIADMYGGKKQYGEKRIEPNCSIAENTKIKTKLNFNPKNNLKDYLKNKYHE